MQSERLLKYKERLNAYYACEMAILDGQSYSIGSRTLTRANLAWVKTQIKELEIMVDELEAQQSGKGKRKSFRITPRDI